MPVSSQRSIDGVMNSVKGLDAVPEPERLPTGITTFIPVVVKMRETKAAEAAEADRAKEAIETVAAPSADKSEPQTVGGADNTVAPEAVAAPAADAPVAETGETIGVYMTSSDSAEPEATLDTFI
ncbi:hypothetical protein [Amaricoccus macauensis]|uniref:hypothetical protein n=1 Tax=Amaricoccus macauensis TaxID=57001 RepID=UPI003C7CD007